METVEGQQQLPQELIPPTPRLDVTRCVNRKDTSEGAWKNYTYQLHRAVRKFEASGVKRLVMQRASFLVAMVCWCFAKQAAQRRLLRPCGGNEHKATPKATYLSTADTSTGTGIESASC